MCEEGVEAHRVSSVLLGGEDHVLRYSISERKSFYLLRCPFFPHLLCLYRRFVSA